ncbi:MAG TPA: hypothetical protein DCZ75_05125 [Geobacter sp.]|nr:hypothetical protein [Geobacter sp.]
MIKRIVAPMTAAILALAGTALAAEFQPFGALGIGGAGVARTTNAMAGYWNPAGLAFNEKTVSVPIAVGTGLRVSSGLADNVDRLSKFTEGSPSTLDNLKNINTSAVNAQALGDIVSLLSVIKDIETQKGTISLGGNAVVAAQVNHFSFGAFGTIEGFAKPESDLVNVLPSGSSGTTALTTTEFANLAAAPGDTVATSNLFFTDAQVRSGIYDSLRANGFDDLQANNIINAMDARLATTDGLTQQQAADVLTNTVVPAFTSGGSIDNNQTSVMVKSLAYFEFPISYGHPIDLGKYGKLGVGASLKPIKGRVYASKLRLVEGDSVDSGNITDNLDKNYVESSSVTIDLGAFYKYQIWSVGLVAKNLTSPKFDAPDLKDQNGQFVLDGSGNHVKTDKVTLKPQVRLGVAVDPLSWLTLAADLDLTSNETVLSSLDYKSRHFGGGAELHPLTWLKLRLGMYKNLSNDDIGPVATGGVTIGTKWVNFDIDGAYGLETAKYKESDYPKEARVQAALNIQF